MELIELFEKRYRLSGKTVSALFSEMEQVSFSKQETIQKAGGKDYYVYFVESGVVRSYIQREGKEVTLSIVARGQIPLSSAGLTRPVVSRIAVGALTDCVLWRLSRTRLGELCRESLIFANFARELVEGILADTEVYWTDYYSLDKKAQYKLLLKQQPELFRQIALNEVASYLDITPQSLSRIRAGRD